jgi:hypothetical protein
MSRPLTAAGIQWKRKRMSSLKQMALWGVGMTADFPVPGELVAVPCAGAAVLALYDLDGEEFGQIPVGRDPVHATVTAGRVFVATMGERSVTVVTASGDVSKIDIGVLGPAHFTAVGERLLVPCSASDVVAVIDAGALAFEGRVPVGAEPHDVGIAGSVAIAGSRIEGVLTGFDPVTRDVITQYEVPNSDTARIQGVDAAEAPGMDAVYAVDQANDTVHLADAYGIRESVGVGATPYEAEVTTDRVFVAARDGAVVHELTPSLSVREVHQTAPGPEGVVCLMEAVWVYHRETPVLWSLRGREIELPAPVLTATPVGAVFYTYFSAYQIKANPVCSVPPVY